MLRKQFIGNTQKFTGFAVFTNPWAFSSSGLTALRLLEPSSQGMGCGWGWGWGRGLQKCRVVVSTTKALTQHGAHYK